MLNKIKQYFTGVKTVMSGMTWASTDMMGTTKKFLGVVSLGALLLCCTLLFDRLAAIINDFIIYFF